MGEAEDSLAEEIEEAFDSGSGALALGDLEGAVLWYRRVVELDAAHFDAWHALGLALMKTGDLDGAIGAGLMATELKPNDLLAWTAMSQIYVRAGKIGEAEDAKGKARILSLGGKVVKDS
jgi:Flp pilus assembly protein TadD